MKNQQNVETPEGFNPTLIPFPRMSASLAIHVLQPVRCTARTAVRHQQKGGRIVYASSNFSIPPVAIETITSSIKRLWRFKN